MSNRQLVLIERLLRFAYELNQAQPSVYVGGRSANSVSNAFNGVSVGLKFDEGGVSLCLVERMHVHALHVFNLSSVRKKRSTTYTMVVSQRSGILIYS